MVYDQQLDKKGDYKLTVFVNNENHVVKGLSLAECFNKLDPKQIVKGKCFFTVEKGKLKSTMQLSPMRTKRLFVNLTYRTIMEKQLNLRLT